MKVSTALNDVTQSFKFNKPFTELETEDLLELELNDLPAFLEHNRIKPVYRAKNRAYQFDVLADDWQLGLNETLYLNWMWNAKIPVIVVLMLRLGLARQAEFLAFPTINTRIKALKKIRFSISDPRVFQASYHKLIPSSKITASTFFNRISRDDSPRYIFLQQFFSDVVDFLAENGPPERAPQGQNILDPVKGMYSEAEELEINTKLRLRITKVMEDCRDGDSFLSDDLNKFGSVIAATLNKSIFRRSVQLVQLKWIDVLPVGVSFASHRKACPNETPIEEHLFSDVEELHIRTFRGKSGEFRKQAESRSHRIEAGYSNVILQYRMEYQRRLDACLATQNIALSKEELAEIMFRLPIFPYTELFMTEFGSKAALFQSVGYHSEAFHKTSNALQANVSLLSASLNLVSERNLKGLRLSNNRFRHTVLSNGTWANMDEIALSKITGVTPKAVIPYIDLSTESRLKIDAAFAGQKVIKQFGMVSAAELSKSEQFKVTNEFGEEQGVLHKASDCSTCASKLGRPLGCYGCDNFRPHIEGNHRENLEKAQKKLSFNQDGGSSPITIRKLERSIIYIQATIFMCNEYSNTRKGIADDRN